MASEQQKIFALFPSHMREVLEALDKAKKVAILGQDIHVDLSEAITLPRQFDDRTYELKRRGGATEEVKGNARTPKYFFAKTKVICFSVYHCKGALDGYTLHIKGNLIDNHKPQIDDAVFGKTKAKKTDYHFWNFGGMSVNAGEGLRITASPRKDAILYCYLVLSHLDSRNIIFSDVDRTLLGAKQVGLFTYRDPAKETITKNDNLIQASAAIMFVSTLNAEQIKLLKEKVIADVGYEAAELAKATIKDTIATELMKLAQKGYGGVIIKYKTEFETTETPALETAKGILADAMAMGVLDYDKENGLLIGQQYESKFASVCKGIKIGDGFGEYTRLQFHEAAPKIAQTVSEYLANYPNIGDAKTLTTLVDEMRLTFSELDIVKSGVPEFNSLRKRNGIFKKYITD